MPRPDKHTALLAALEALLPPGMAAWVSEDPGSEQPGRDGRSATGAGHVGRESCGAGGIVGDVSNTRGATRAGDTSSPDALDPLWPEELPATTGMRPARLREFRHGRHCARRALAALGRPATAIPMARQRSPGWPDGIVGSISHAREWALAVVAPASDFAGLGVDLERDEPLNGADRAMFGTEAEFAWLARRLPVDPVKATFSAKESVYKCLWPLTRRFIDFTEIELLPGPGPGAFRAAWRGPGQLPATHRLQGRIAKTGNWIITAAWLPAHQ